MMSIMVQQMAVKWAHLTGIPIPCINVIKTEIEGLKSGRSDALKPDRKDWLEVQNQ